MPKMKKEIRKITLIGSVTLAASIILLALLVLWDNKIFDDLVFFAFVVAVFPPALLNYLDYRRRKAIDSQLPELFRSIVQAQETGMTLPQALEEASKRDYGSLTRELRRMTMQISWGLSFEEALINTGQRVKTVLMQRSVPMVIEASRSGGHVERVFDPMGKFVQSTLLLDKERRTRTRPYIAIIYVAFFVFLFTIILLFRSFFVGVEQLPMLGTGAMDAEEMKRLFFHMTSVQAFFGGLVAGKMGEGAISAGLKHSLILMLLGYLASRVFV
jgi:flagellar protein FlaJ